MVAVVLESAMECSETVGEAVVVLVEVEVEMEAAKVVYWAKRSCCWPGIRLHSTTLSFLTSLVDRTGFQFSKHLYM